MCGACARRGLHCSRGTPLGVCSRIGAGYGLPTRVSVRTARNVRCGFLYIAGNNNSTGGACLCRRAGTVLGPNALIPFVVRGVGALNATTYPPCRVTIIVNNASTRGGLLAIGLTSARCCSRLPAANGRCNHTFQSVRLRGRILTRIRGVNLKTRFNKGCLTRSVHVVHLPQRNTSYPINLNIDYSTSHGIGYGVGGSNV